MRIIRPLLALMATTLGFSGAAHAETLGDAIATAYQTNPTLLSQRAQLRALDETYVQARTDYRPTVSVTAVGQALSQDSRNAQGVTSTYNGNGGSAFLSASQVISSGGRTAAQVSIATAGIGAGRERLRSAEAAVLYQVIDAYASVLRDQETVKIRVQTVAALERQVEVVRERANGGEGARIDVSQAEAQLASSRVGLASARAGLDASRARYKALVGAAPEALAPLARLPGMPASVDAAFDVGETESPLLAEARMNERSAQGRVWSARAQSRPVVSFNANYGYSGLSEAGDRFRPDQEMVASLKFTMPLFTGGLNQSLRRQAVAQASSAQVEIEAARRAVQQNIAQAWSQSAAADEQLTQSEVAVREANVAVEGARMAYQEGYRSTFEVLSEEIRLLDTRLSVVQARYIQTVSQAALLASMGRLEAPRLADGVEAYDPAKNFRQIKSKGAMPWEPVIAAADHLTGPLDGLRPSAPIRLAALKTSYTPAAAPTAPVVDTPQADTPEAALAPIARTEVVQETELALAKTDEPPVVLAAVQTPPVPTALLARSQAPTFVPVKVAETKSAEPRRFTPWKMMTSLFRSIGQGAVRLAGLDHKAPTPTSVAPPQPTQVASAAMPSAP